MAPFSARKKVLDIIAEAHGSLPFPLHVKYLTIEEAIRLGGYSLVDKSICKQFEYTKKDSEYPTACLLNENSTTLAEELSERLCGLRHATLEELLAFGIQYPEAQRHFPVVAAGSQCKISPISKVMNAPYLSGNQKERRLCLGANDFGWSSAFRFLLINMSPQP